MKAVWAFLAAAVAALTGTAVLGELISQEIRGRLDQVPHGLIRLAARRLQPELREDLAEEWTAELGVILRGAQSLPVTRLYRGTRYALGLLRAAPSIGRDLSKTTLSHAGEMRALSPLTGLPGNNRIEQEIQARMERNTAIAVVYADLDNFKSFNDRYGFLRGDEVISLAAQVLRLAAQEAAGPDGFVGHIGGDDFVAILPPEAAEVFSRRVIESFDARILSLYDPEDAGAGMIELEDRQGQLRRFPIVSMSLGIASNAQRSFSSPREVVATATELKSLAKKDQGSSFAMDRRNT